MGTGCAFATHPSQTLNSGGGQVNMLWKWTDETGPQSPNPHNATGSAALPPVSRINEILASTSMNFASTKGITAMEVPPEVSPKQKFSISLDSSVPLSEEPVAETRKVRGKPRRRRPGEALISNYDQEGNPEKWCLEDKRDCILLCKTLRRFTFVKSNTKWQHQLLKIKWVTKQSFQKRIFFIFRN